MSNEDLDYREHLLAAERLLKDAENSIPERRTAVSYQAQVHIELAKELRISEC